MADSSTVQPSDSSLNSTATPTIAAPGDATAARLAMSGLVSGAENVLKDIAGRVFNVDFRNANGSSILPERDWRVRISMQPQTANLFYGSQANPLMYPLAQTKGVIFPYTPSITMNHVARYGSSQLTHSNYAAFFYEGSEVQQIVINGDFTVQDVEEGRYLMAVIQFFRSCTKMFFGGSSLAGTPPPLVFLDGYGSTYFPHIPCVIMQFTHTMPNDPDYVEIPLQVNYDLPGGFEATSPYIEKTRLPTTSTISVTLQPVYSRKNIHDSFTLEQYSKGALNRGPTDAAGGFI